ncbi:RHS repeat-associated core domain-containing protein, partial [Promicromonospora citrea]
PGDHEFLGKVRDEATGLTLVGARWYDETIGRFLTVDPVMDLTDPQQWNAYAYSNNNPVTYSDPTGLWWEALPVSNLVKSSGTVAAASSSSGLTGGPSCRYASCDGTAMGGEDWFFKHDGYQLGVAVKAARTADFYGGMSPKERARQLHLEQEYKDNANLFSQKNLQAYADFGYYLFIEDAVKCLNGDGFGCLWFAVGFIPLGGKGAKLLKKPVSEVVDTIVTATRKKDAQAAANAANAGRGLCSFAGATLVLMADGTHKPIKDVKVSDEVIATDPQSGEQAAMPVTHVWVHEDDLLEFEVDGELIVTTEDHPFWSVTDQAWEGTQSLERGEVVLGADGRGLRVTRSVDIGKHERGDAYNLTVAGAHTYHVGRREILVHNSGRPGPGDIYLWRAVTHAELADVQNTRTWNSPQGIKYFSFTEEGAADYARQAYARYPQEGAYTMLRTTVSADDLPEEVRMAYTTDVKAGGVALNNDELKILGRPSIMPGGIPGAGVC